MANPSTPSPVTQDQFESLNSQIGTLQNLVFALQSQQSSKNTNLPQITPGSANNAIAQVSQVRVLGQTAGPTGTQITLGFNTPGGINTRLIDHYNVFLQLGNNTPAVVASVQHSPCTFTLSSQFNNVNGIVGVQTVMQDGSSLPFTQCPTATLTISIASANLNQQTLLSFSVTSGTPVNYGNSFTAPSTGTYYVLISLQIGSTSSGSVVCTLLQNGGAVGNTFTVQVNTLTLGPSSVGMFLLPLTTGDVLQLQVNATFTGTFATSYYQRAILKQFSS